MSSMFYQLNYRPNQNNIKKFFMRNISIGQIIVLLIICFLLFGDFQLLKRKSKYFLTKFNKFFKKQEKKDLNP